MDSIICYKVVLKALGLNILQKKFKGNKNITTNICGIQVYNSVMCGYFCTGFIDFMLKVKSLLDYTNLFLILLVSIGNLNPKISYIFLKTLVISINFEKCDSKHKRLFNKEESIEILNIFVLINNVDGYRKNR